MPVLEYIIERLNFKHLFKVCAFHGGQVKLYREYKLLDSPLTVEYIKVFRGASFFSEYPTILIRLDLGEYDEVFSNSIKGLYEKLRAILPSLVEHKCSPGKRGGFFQRVRHGTLLGHIMEHVALELQNLAGMNVSYGKTRSTLKKGVYNVVMGFEDEIAGLFAAKAAFNLVTSLLIGTPFDVDAIIATLIEIREERLLGPSTRAIVDEADKRGIPWQRLDEYNLVQLGTGKYAKRIKATITGNTSLVGVEMAENKLFTCRMLKDSGIPVPETTEAHSCEELFEFAEKFHGPVVLKPLNGSFGRGLRKGLENKEQLKSAYDKLSDKEERVLCQREVTGKTYRLLVINYSFVAAVELEAPYIVGDGEKTLVELIEKLNGEQGREVGDKGSLSIVNFDDLTADILEERGMDGTSVPEAGEMIILKNSGNPRLGGKATDVTDLVHPYNIFCAERAAKALELDVAGVDIVSPSIECPINENGGKVLGVSAAPDFRMHHSPWKGVSRNAAGSFVDTLFPEGSPTRIPLFSVTGSAGKTIAVNLIKHVLKQRGLTVGNTSTEGLYVDDVCLVEGDTTYSEHVSMLLKDKSIECAILETSREGILRSGLGYKFADFGIVLNMFNEHIGKDDIEFLEDMAYAKAVVAEQVYDGGFAVLNADDALIIEMMDRAYSNVALFSRDYQNKILREHTDNGGLGVVLDGCKLIILHQRDRKWIADLSDIPLTFGSRAEAMYDSLLAATAALFAFGMNPDELRAGLTTFIPDRKNLPGRMNMMEIRDFKVLLDYAHNVISMEYLRQFLASFSGTIRGVVDVPGDKSDEEIREIGKKAWESYDFLYFYEGHDMRGRKEGEIVTLLKEGALQGGAGEEKIRLFNKPEAAWTAGLEASGAGDTVVILSGRSGESIEAIDRFVAAKINLESEGEL